MTQPPDNPAGPFERTEDWSQSAQQVLMDAIEKAPSQLQQAVLGLTESQLDTLYKNWTIRQIVHHLADSHLHSYIRFKWTLTEEQPTIKAYEEADWVLLADSKHGDITPSLHLLGALHLKWVQLLKTMDEVAFARTFVHPQSGETVSLWTALTYYPWHARHHTAQILWLREQNAW